MMLGLGAAVMEQMTYRTIMLILRDCLNRFDARDARRNEVVEVVCGEDRAHGVELGQGKT